MDLNNIRKEYYYSSLSEDNITNEPFSQFNIWLDEAIAANLEYPTAMSAITIGDDGFPQSRIVLLKDFNKIGFAFFTNYNSSKGLAIKKNNAIGLHFFWPELERQVRISGFAEQTTEEVSENYFYTRPLSSQIAAIVSNQSEKIPSREYLEDCYSKFENDKKKKVIRPKHWGGYLVKPVNIEFWQGRESRIHDRILYELKDDNWTISRLAP